MEPTKTQRLKPNNTNARRTWWSHN